MFIEFHSIHLPNCTVTPGFDTRISILNFIILRQAHQFQISFFERLTPMYILYTTQHCCSNTSNHQTQNRTVCGNVQACKSGRNGLIDGIIIKHAVYSGIRTLKKPLCATHFHSYKAFFYQKDTTTMCLIGNTSIYRMNQALFFF